jgi:DNA polymerase elongation subunit (family B)
MGMIPELEELYPEGSDITIMNTYYNFPLYSNGKKQLDDFIAIVYKDNVTDNKNYKIIYKPDYTYYKLKNKEDEVDYNRLFIEKEKVEPVSVPFMDLEKSIAEQTGNVEFFKSNAYDRARRRNNQRLHTHTGIFFSDVNIEDHYRFKFAQTYSNKINKLNKGFFDIEVDGKYSNYDFVRMGECPINCVSFYDDKTDTSYTYILRNKDNPLVEKFEKEVISGEVNQEYISQFVTGAVGGPKYANKFRLENTQFKLFFFDFEIDLIRELFSNMHRCSPDFILGWNSSSFDLTYIIERIKTLGYDPGDIMCDQGWPVKIVKNYVDTRKQNELAERGDYTFISGLPVFIDQMIQYASRRKSKIGSFKSFKLDDIGEREAGVKKLDYHHITSSVVELPWLDFKTFVLYNIMDVIVQKCIEHKTNDLEYIFSKCVINNTIYRKGHRQTVYLINRMASDWYKKGFIIGNNCNKNNPKPPKYLGALVGDPTHTNNYSKIKIDGRAIWICDNLQDYDYKSLYPSIMGEFNIAPNTQIGRIDIPEKVYDHENTYHIDAEKYSRSGEFIENMVTDNLIEYCHRWFHLANFKEILQDIDEYYSRDNMDKFGNLFSAGFRSGSKQSPIIPTSYNSTMNPIEFGRTSKVETPIVFFNRRDKLTFDDYSNKRKEINK